MKKLRTYIIEHSSTLIERKGDDEMMDVFDEDGSDETSDNDEEEKEDEEAMKPVEDDSAAKEDEKERERAEIKFKIWKEPDKCVDWLNKGDNYQKIEYKHIDKKAGIEVDFLLGQQNDIWKLWMGKIGACSYDEDPYCSFNTKSFNDAIIDALDKVQEIISDIKEDPDNYIQYYVS